MTTLEMISDLEKKYFTQLYNLQVLKAWEHIRLQGVDIDQIDKLQLTNMSRFELEIRHKIKGGTVYEYCIMKDGSRIKISPVVFPK